MSGASSSSPAGAAFSVFTFFVVACIFVLAPFARAQNGTQATTDPSEGIFVNSLSPSH